MDELNQLLAINAGIGGNNPPDEIALLRERLADTNELLLDRRDSLLAAQSRVPASIETEVDAGRVADYIVQISACSKAAEGARISAKEPFLLSGRAVDGFFRTITDPLDALKRDIERRLTVYQRRKAEEERQRREAEARRQAEEAERRHHEAAEAEAAIRAEADLAKAIEAQRIADEARAAATAATKAAEVKPAELSRSRGEYGAVASLRTFHDFRNLDRTTLDLEALREHLPLAALEQAVRAYIKAGGRKLDGVDIFKNTAVSVR